MTTTTNLPLSPVDYRKAMESFSGVCSGALTRMLDCLKPKTKSQSAGSLGSALAAEFDRHVKTLFTQYEDPVLEREFGIIFGALVTHLQAINARMSVFRDSNNKLVDIEAMSRECVAEATRYCREFSLKGGNCISQLVLAEAQMRTASTIFAALLSEHARQVNLRPSDFSLASPVNYFYVSSVSCTRVLIHGDYQDGTEYCYCSLGGAFKTQAARAELHRIAEQAFGGPVKFDDKLEYILFDRPAILL